MPKTAQHLLATLLVGCAARRSAAGCNVANRTASSGSVSDRYHGMIWNKGGSNAYCSYAAGGGRTGAKAAAVHAELLGPVAAVVTTTTVTTTAAAPAAAAAPATAAAPAAAAAAAADAHGGGRRRKPRAVAASDSYSDMSYGHALPTVMEMGRRLLAEPLTAAEPPLNEEPTRHPQQVRTRNAVALTRPAPRSAHAATLLPPARRPAAAQAAAALQQQPLRSHARAEPGGAPPPSDLPCTRPHTRALLRLLLLQREGRIALASLALAPLHASTSRGAPNPDRALRLPSLHDPLNTH